jgi:hypothetical protein
VKNGREAPDDEDDSEGPNPFDPKRLRISQRFGEGLDVRTIIASVSVRKPHRQWWIRVHPDPRMSIETCVLQNEQDQQHYLVDPSLSSSLPGEAVPMTLYSAINMSGGLFLWPVRLPNEDGQQHECHITAHRAAQLAQTTWIRISWDRANSNYAVVSARGEVPEPAWPEADLQKLLSIAFKGRLIEDLDHSVLKRLRGEF